MAHCDVKLANVVMDDDFNCKLIDLGFAQERKSLVESVMGTPRYMASELCHLKEGTPELNPVHTWEKADVFSCGVLLFVLRFGNFPFKSASFADKDYKLFIEDTDEFLKTCSLTKEKMAQGKISREFISLLRSMLWPIAKQRPTLKQLLEKSAWLTQEDRKSVV